MSTSADTDRLLRLLAKNRDAVDATIRKFGLTDPRLFGSVAQGTASPDSDIDLLVDAVGPQDGHSAFMNVLGCIEELQNLLGVRVDVVTPSLAKEHVLEAALREGIPLWVAVSRNAPTTSSNPSHT